MKILAKLATIAFLACIVVGTAAQHARADGPAPASPLDVHWASYLVWAAVLGLAALALKMLSARLDKIEQTLQGVASTQAMTALESRLEAALVSHQRAQEERLRQYFRLAGRIRRIEDRCLLVHGQHPVSGVGGRGSIEPGPGAAFEDDNPDEDI